MKEFTIRRAEEYDISDIYKLLFEVNKVHSDVRPDLFKAGAKKYSDDELKKIIADDKTPVFVADKAGKVLGYVFCVHKQYINDSNMTDIKHFISTIYVSTRRFAANISGNRFMSMLLIMRRSTIITT